MRIKGHNSTPPRWPLQLLKSIWPGYLYEMIEGDLLEEFKENLDEIGYTRARRRFIWSAIMFIHPYIFRNRQPRAHDNPSNMLPHYVIMAFRQLMRSKVLSAINVIGITVGIATYFVIARYVSFESSYENFHQGRDHIYRIAYLQHAAGDLKLASARNFIGMPNLVQHLPEVAAITAFDRTAQQAYFQFIYENKTFHQQGSFYQTDGNFFNVFPSLLIKGDPSSALSDPHGLVISQEMASIIFGDEDPIGKKIENRSYSYSQVESFTVTGVMTDVPQNSHFHLNFIAKNSNNEEIAPENHWTEPRYYTYMSLQPGSDPTSVTNKINALLEVLSIENPKIKGVTVELQPIADIHNYSKLSEELEPNGDAMLLYILSIIGIVILVSAYINYVNVETGKLLSRRKEIGVRKILGSAGADLALQFSIEYLITTTIAIVLALTTLYVFDNWFGYVLDLPHFNYWASPIWQWACVTFIGAMIIAGVFPTIGFIRRRSHENALLKSTSSYYKAPLRSGLITFQFASSMSLIAMLMVTNKQLDLMMTTNKKIDIENVVSIRNPTVYTNEDSVNAIEYGSLRNELLSNSMIKQTTGSSAIPGMEVEVAFINRIKRNLGDPYDPTPFKLLFVDYDYIPFYNLKLKAGRNYLADSGEDDSWSTIILNESAVRSLGFSSAEDAKDQEVYFHLWGTKFEKYKIVGVVEDYHHETSKKLIQPTILSLNHRQFQQVFFSVKLNKETNPQEALAFVESKWKELFPDRPFDYFFQDEYYDRQFKAERRSSTVFILFAGVAMLIAFLGVVGMTLFETTSRLKEVTVRKVLGASFMNLVALFSSSYLRFIITASVCCIPVISYFSANWLENYPLRIDVSVWFYLVPLITVAAVVVFASGWQTIKVSLTNPVDHLRHE